ncbi:GntR family transcriptional regulator [Lederbergia sp. NSJ-179]|uniref:GntR family transcriptional regulator n=1 Tax=Lederbergia sp. NSJ-179 TaxID=2931402 RepID=UPI001FD1BE77|nr:GntR family transcriptional regulator [Lederbergia sp. NSJ-179]MCJ7840036.1 GntR family transcriptional regulator [Lederbergia sp. NSJ-179]
MSRHIREPLYLQIKEHFKQLITSKQLNAHDQIPPEREIMEDFNVSRITVTNALTELVQEGWIYRIPGKGSYVKEMDKFPSSDQSNVEEKSLQMEEAERSASRDTKRKLIGLIMPTIVDSFAVRLINGIQSELQKTEYSIVIMLSNNSKKTEQTAIRELLRMGVAGLLIFPVDAETYNDDILELKVRNFPFVLVDRYLPGVETNYVNSDNVTGTMLAVSHLWDLGHRDIVICADSPRSTITIEDRIKGYMNALRERGAMINPSFILTDFTVDYHDLEEDGLFHQLLMNGAATAYITLNAKLGLYLSKLAEHLNVKIPDDISIVTFDNPHFDDELGDFTHIFQSENTIGKEAATILLQLLKEDQNDGACYEKRIIPPKLVVNGSTGPAPMNENQ